MSDLLRQLKHPRQLRRLTLEQLEDLAAEVREAIVDTVSKNGGHLAPSLGVVELTLALYSLLDLERDRVVWDVGHQAYPHKLLTGRFDRFHTLRQYGGLSGFLKPEESPFDHFAAGHASTSISAALGMALARDLKQEKHRVVAVIGDGSLTGGMALEAINHAGHLPNDLLVILNDNDLSIAPNVGAMGAYLNRLRTHPAYTNLKQKAKTFRGPGLGQTVVRSMDRFKDALKYATLIGGRTGGVFEELGFTYLGPVDGHDLRKLVPMLELALSVKGPVLLHVGTIKGKGYAPAEQNPSFYHGVAPFDKETGAVKKSPNRLKSQKTFTQVFGEALVRCGQKNERVVAITAAMPDGTGVSPFAAAFPERTHDVGICEEHAVTMAAGLASRGFVPVVAIYSTFIQRAVDQIVHDVCMQGLPVVFALDRAGIVGEDGPTHHGIFDLAFLRMIPGMTILAPADAAELDQMLDAAIRLGGPVALRYPRGTASPGNPDPDFKIGEARFLREGEDLLILSVGSMLERAEEAAELLEREGVSVSLADVRTVLPFDEGLLERASRHRAILSIEEGVVGGFGSLFLEKLTESGLNRPFRMLTLPTRFIEHGPADLLRDECGLSSAAIASAAHSLLSKPVHA